jgi:hypothetical protein
LLRLQPDVEVHVDDIPDGVVPELVVTGSRVRSPGVVLSIGSDGSARLELPRGELTGGVIAAAVNAARHRRPATDWVEVLIASCSRVDHLLEEATTIAEDVYRDDGTFADWRLAFAEHRYRTTGAPLTSTIATDSRSVDELFATPAGQSQLVAVPWPEQHPLARLIADYHLDGRQLDILLLAFVHELDPRYGHRFAYLQRDVGLQLPTVDVIAALLAADAADRLVVQRELLSGTLPRSGLISLTKPVGHQRSRVVTLDPSVIRMLLGDAEAFTGQLVIDPADSPRSQPPYRPRSEATVAAAMLADGESLHLHGATTAERRSVATDIADLLGERVLVVNDSGDGEGTRLTEPDTHHLWRECIRLGARALIDIGSDPATGPLASSPSLGPWALTAGNRSAKPEDHPAGSPRRNIEVRPIPVADREAVWEAACRFTGIEIAGDRYDLATRYGVTVDRAASALQVAAGGATAGVPATDVLQALGEATADDAGGLLRITTPRVRLDDLVITDEVKAALDVVVARIRHRDLVVSEAGWDQQTSRLSGTYLMFAGLPGTGKTMAGEAVAGELGLPVQHLEISSLLSRWVGDFEAAVDRVFAAAESSGAILLANEADAILSPRVEVDSAQAHYANAGTSHLLSRLEGFTGHVIFTSNLVGAANIDPAFHRRLTATIRFPMPAEAERRRLWRSVWPTRTRDGQDLCYRFDDETGGNGLLDRLADEQALSGGSIANIARTATFLAAEHLPRPGRPPGATPEPTDTPEPADGESTREITITEDHLRRALAMELTKIGDYRQLMQTRPPRRRPRGAVRPVTSGARGRAS